MTGVETWWWKSRRESAAFACARATAARAFSLLLLPSAVRDRAFCRRRSLRSARRRNLGDRITVPSDTTANQVRPRSTPTSAAEAGNLAAPPPAPPCPLPLPNYHPTPPPPTP